MNSTAYFAAALPWVIAWLSTFKARSVDPRRKARATTIKTHTPPA